MRISAKFSFWSPTVVSCSESAHRLILAKYFVTSYPLQTSKVLVFKIINNKNMHLHCISVQRSSLIDFMSRKQQLMEVYPVNFSVTIKPSISISKRFCFFLHILLGIFLAKVKKIPKWDGMNFTFQTTIVFIMSTRIRNIWSCDDEMFCPGNLSFLCLF